MTKTISTELQYEFEKLLGQIHIKRFDKLRHTRLMTILSYLHFHQEGVNPSQMAEDLNIARPHLTRVIDAMESDGMLERKLSSTDKRRFVLFLTDKGLEQLNQKQAEDQERCDKLFAMLGEQDSLAAIELLKKLNIFVAEEIGTVKDTELPPPHTGHKKHLHNEGDN